MTQVKLSHLQKLYAHTPDPWNFVTSTYEQEKFRATKKALSRDHYAAAFELGCGNGELARHLAPACTAYTGLDAVDKALEACREKLPSADFIKGYYPCPLAPGPFDLIVLSEILYFLGRAELIRLASEISTKWHRAEVICVIYLGETDHALQGRESLEILIAALSLTHQFDYVSGTERYRIHRGLPKTP